MKAVFADTFYFLALLNKSDKAHSRAWQFNKAGVPAVTIAWVLTEVADALAAPENRNAFVQLLKTLRESPDTKIISPSQALFDQGVELYQQRADKEWALAGKVGGRLLAVEYANRESQSSWRDFLVQLKDRGLQGVQFVVSDHHPGLKRALREVLPAVWWQRCSVHFLRNALDYLPRKADDDCLQELRWMYEWRNVDEARRDLKQ